MTSYPPARHSRGRDESPRHHRVVSSTRNARQRSTGSNSTGSNSDTKNSAGSPNTPSTSQTDSMPLSPIQRRILDYKQKREEQRAAGLARLRAQQKERERKKKRSQKISTIVTLTLIPAIITGGAVASAHTLYNDIVVPLTTDTDDCAQAVDLFRQAAHDTRALIVPDGDINAALDRAELTTPLDAKDMTYENWVALGDTAPVLNTLSTIDLLTAHPDTHHIMDKEEATIDTHSLRTVAQRHDPPQENTDSTATQHTEAVPYSNTTMISQWENQLFHIPRVDYEERMSSSENISHRAELAAHVIAMLNGSHDDLMTEPVCTSEKDLQSVALATTDVHILQRSITKNLSAINHQLLFTEVEQWCSPHNSTTFMREFSDSIIARTDDIRDDLEIINDPQKETIPLATLDQDIVRVVPGEIQRATDHANSVLNDLSDPPCMYPDGYGGDISALHTQLADHHDTLDAQFNDLMRTSMAMNIRLTEISNIAGGVETQRQDNADQRERERLEKEEAERQEQERREQEAAEKARKEAEKQRQRNAEAIQRAIEEAMSSSSTTSSTQSLPEETDDMVNDGVYDEFTEPYMSPDDMMNNYEEPMIITIP